MNIRIKTAHGYLSFQPDGRIEYRPVAGPWENLDIEGLELPPVPGPIPPPMVDVGQPTAEYVAQVKARLQAAGVPLNGPCGALAITKQVAWDLRTSGAGLLSKPGGNNCEGYATDVIAYHDRAYDILGDGGNANHPQWAETDVDDLANRWRPAVQP
jgi:hypothetical protein